MAKIESNMDRFIDIMVYEGLPALTVVFLYAVFIASLSCLLTCLMEG